MIISDEAKGNALIGEAAMNLIFNREDVNVNTLLKNLKSMAEVEEDENRLLLMHEVCRWLQGYCSLGSVSPERSGWLDSNYHGSSVAPSRQTIRLVPSPKNRG
ncbi:hypothetical protein BS639_16610 [Rouxiella silvae]|uniref:Uncharacterized protein n=1 Tax=Rouxiella silvae TaxID=1646373 RepID=A0AA41BXB4_9GAMM|nr:hypothetical protein [Rouxiella silvae]KQN46565.1 hypothetical protein ASE93_14975 [Serratia sp. Leaf50]MBF6638010.1 hypothetical protein [Rouxiella silvae]ORJ20101.1 hypothetical protein BS639_16610 [Rouxiella silvae]